MNKKKYLIPQLSFAELDTSIALLLPASKSFSTDEVLSRKIGDALNAEMPNTGLRTYSVWEIEESLDDEEF